MSARPLIERLEAIDPAGVFDEAKRAQLVATVMAEERQHEDDHRAPANLGLQNELVDAGILHEQADRRCVLRDPGDHVHDGARCIRCRGRHDDPILELGKAIERDGDVIRARARLDELDREVEAAEAALGRAVLKVQREPRPPRQGATS